MASVLVVAVVAVAYFAWVAHVVRGLRRLDAPEPRRQALPLPPVGYHSEEYRDRIAHPQTVAEVQDRIDASMKPDRRLRGVA